MTLGLATSVASVMLVRQGMRERWGEVCVLSGFPSAFVFNFCYWISGMVGATQKRVMQRDISEEEGGREVEFESGDNCGRRGGGRLQ